jgi:anaerobic dimethyl sulfoxide reductase subunit C
MNVREWALPVFTILMQLATGALCMLWVIRHQARQQIEPQLMKRIIANPLMIIFLSALLGVIGSHFHLSRPLQSFLAVLNFRTSWLSREIVMTMFFMLLVGVIIYLLEGQKPHHRLIDRLGWLAVLFGLASVYSMAMIYLLPTQPYWNTPVTILLYYCSTALLGVVALTSMLILDLRILPNLSEAEIQARNEIIRKSLSWSALIALVTTGLIILLNLYKTLSLQGDDPVSVTSLELILGIYQPLLSMRYLFLLAGVAWFGYSAYLLNRQQRAPAEMLMPIYLSCLLVMIAEILGRFLFYAVHVRIGI